MNVLVVGCGRQGTLLAELLDRNGHDVAVIDAEKDNFRSLSDDFNGITVDGMPMDMTVLKNAGVESCDAVVVVTPDDNLNITVSQIVRHFFGVENVVARISDPARENVFHRFGLKTVCPTKLAGNAMVTALAEPWEEKQVTFDVSTVSFSCHEVEHSFIDCNINLVPVPPGQMILGVVHANGNMELNSGDHKLILTHGDKIVYARMSD